MLKVILFLIFISTEVYSSQWSSTNRKEKVGHDSKDKVEFVVFSFCFIDFRADTILRQTPQYLHSGIMSVMSENISHRYQFYIVGSNHS